MGKELNQEVAWKTDIHILECGFEKEKPNRDTRILRDMETAIPDLHLKTDRIVRSAHRFVNSVHGGLEMAENKSTVEDIAILEEAVATNVGTVGTPK